MTLQLPQSETERLFAAVPGEVVEVFVLLDRQPSTVERLGKRQWDWKYTTGTNPFGPVGGTVEVIHSVPYIAPSKEFGGVWSNVAIKATVLSSRPEQRNGAWGWAAELKRLEQG